MLGGVSNADTSYAFQIQARAPKGVFALQAYLEAISTQNNPQGSTIPLGWAWNGAVPFVLAGASDNFTSNNPPLAWMQSARGTLGARTLREICMPGAHDAGMSARNGGTAGAFDCNSLTQTAGVAGQLAAGARYFDVRPAISGGEYYTGHYSDLGNVTWQGANGQSVQSIVDDVNAFTAGNAELVILDLSHDLNTDVGNDAYRNFNQGEWDALFALLAGSLQHLFVAPGDSTSVDLTLLTLDQFIGAGTPAVVVIFSPGDASTGLGAYHGQGFYTYAQLNAYNSYSNTNDAATMVADQLAKLQVPGVAYRLLSWTLTQDATEAATCEFGTASGILDLARAANPLLYSKLLPACSAGVFPNVLFVDDMSDSAIVPLAMAVNQFLVSTSALRLHCVWGLLMLGFLERVGVD